MRRSLVIALVTASATACTVVGIRSGTEEPAYELVDTLGEDVEVRHYAPRLAAETTVAAGPDARNDAFRRLAGYIFGGNQEARRIAMTAPVETTSAGREIAMTVPVELDAAADQVRMRFFLPADLTLATAPVPNDPQVHLLEIPAQTLAVHSFTGGTSDAAVARAANRLATVLAASAWQPSGAAVAYFYDPPWTLPPLRRNEVVIQVDRPG